MKPTHAYRLASRSGYLPRRFRLAMPFSERNPRHELKSGELHRFTMDRLRPVTPRSLATIAPTL